MIQGLCHAWGPATPGALAGGQLLRSWVLSLASLVCAQEPGACAITHRTDGQSQQVLSPPVRCSWKPLTHTTSAADIKPRCPLLQELLPKCISMQFPGGEAPTWGEHHLETKKATGART